jgi:hypothetical protein
MLYGVAQACSIRDRRSTIRDAAGADMLYGVGALAFRGAPGADVGAPCHPSRERVILLSFLFYFFCATLRPDSGIANWVRRRPRGRTRRVDRTRPRRRRWPPARGDSSANGGAPAAAGGMPSAPRRPSPSLLGDRRFSSGFVRCAPLALDSRIVACLMLLAAPRRFPSAVAVQVAVQSHARGGPAARVMSSRRRR